jgi:hypothetical protein
MGLLGSKTYRVTGTVPGLLVSRKVTKTVTGRRAAENEMTRLVRRGATNVRRSGGPWWLG